MSSRVPTVLERFVEHCHRDVGQKPPGQLLRSVALTICAATSLGLFVGMFVDYRYYYPEAAIGVELMEWVGFTLILCIVFFVPRIPSRGV